MNLSSPLSEPSPHALRDRQDFDATSASASQAAGAVHDAPHHAVFAGERASAAALPTPVAINGKFTSQRLTGVQRVAHEFTSALARLLPGERNPTLVVPRDHASDALPPAVARRVVPRLRGALWEQLALPFATRGQTLVSLCNVGPLFKRNQVVMIHDVAVFDFPQGYSLAFRLWYRFAFWMLKRNARHILTVSRFSKERIVARLGVAPTDVSTIVSGVDHFGRIDSDPSVLERLGLAYDGFVLIVGSIAPGKNLARTLDAIARLERARPELKFVIAGGSNVKIFGTSTLGDNASARNVTWAGYVSDGELKALYENAGCFVFPSLYEGFGLPPLEAMYCGCPVIVSREASLPEACGDAALYCDAHDATDIAATIAQLMGDAELRREMRGKGRRHASRFRWDVAAKQLIGVLRALD
ncbi:glycosyltransferase family 4 protein [Burkholderia oklahomensis]|uniref:Glycosyl transferases group 1 family protein n=1 Tax=Burkholderia oklahomensis TaxID=342113 RepID=A0AAI8B9S9_9BURK|nr:glycosyltransferase family 1 protein [Burkholderia oklahomensis]AIO68312.1 glycosyl transferases group 1 family protein [Burkholderia oklahomensis]AOI43536.1 glycosyl transferase family 1 [Burkholderia oklahomensis EO147]KUY49179.1 glycosyl transferase family 1 [Burkholderia oklahomensis EO147]MDN7673186.1 glycosyltransferase family 1 protein [Burkholderia oklahomensis]QPS38286.1 glycosyltransferase family 4 protein [Burkholderia oklahomensis]